MNNSNHVIIFDLDETLTIGNLPVIITELWIGENKVKLYVNNIYNIIVSKLMVWPFKRMFEYGILSFIKYDFMANSMENIFKNNINYNAVKRLKKYKILGFRVIIVTAGPRTTSCAFASYLGVEYISSEVKFGIIISDLLGKKEKIYKAIQSEGAVIRSIYSDSVLDFSKLSKNNLLVGRSSISIYKK